jgi:membrane protease YdiL (CAAX protease family)
MAMAIAVVIGSVFIALIPIMIIIGIVAGGEIEDDDESVTAATIGAGFLLEALLLLAVALFTVGKYNLRWSELGFRPPRRGGYWFPAPLFFAAFAILFVNAGIASAVGTEAEGNLSDELFDSALLVVLLGILSLALAPIMEETFFRGFLFGGLRGRWGLLGAAFGSGFLFALAHFTGLSSLPLLPAIGMIGMLFAWAYNYTGSLFAPIGAHFLFNLVAFLIAVFDLAPA